MSGGNDHARLLPWTGAEGKPGCLLTDGTGHLSRRADTVERLQRVMAGDLLGHAADLLGDRRATSDRLRSLLARMRESLTDVRRIAENRDARLAATRSPRPTPGGR